MGTNKRARVINEVIAILKKRKRPVTYDRLVQLLGDDAVTRNAISSILRTDRGLVVRVLPKRSNTKAPIGFLWNRWSNAPYARKDAAVRALSTKWRSLPSIFAKMSKQLYSSVPGVVVDDQLGTALARLVADGLAEERLGDKTRVRLTLSGWLKQQTLRKCAPVA